MSSLSARATHFILMTGAPSSLLQCSKKIGCAILKYALNFGAF